MRQPLTHKIQLDPLKKFNNPLFEKFIIEGCTVQRIDDPNECRNCSKQITEITTESKIDGKITIWPAICNPCKKKAYLVYLEERKKEDYLLSRGKCCGAQNYPVKHSDDVVYLDAVKRDLPWQGEFITYILNVLAGSERKGAVLSGNTGNGKTLLAKILHNELIKQYRHTAFTKAVDLAQAIRKETLSKDDYRVVTSQFRNVDCLIIDDYGTAKNTEFVRETLYTILDYRYENKKQTILTTNLNADELNKMEPRIYSRLCDPHWMKRFHFLAYDMRVTP